MGGVPYIMCDWFPCKKVPPYKRLPYIKGLPISGDADIFICGVPYCIADVHRFSIMAGVSLHKVHYIPLIMKDAC